MKNEDGFTLVEVLLSIAILSIFLIGISNFLVNHYQYTTSFDHKVSSIQLANDVLRHYQKEPFSMIMEKVNTSEEVDLYTLLEDTYNHEELEDFSTKVSFHLHENPTLRDHIVKIRVEVIPNGNKVMGTTQLEGFVSND